MGARRWIRFSLAVVIGLTVGMAASWGKAAQTIKLAHAVGTQDPYQC